MLILGQDEKLSATATHAGDVHIGTSIVWVKRQIPRMMQSSNIWWVVVIKIVYWAVAEIGWNRTLYKINEMATMNKMLY